MGSLAFHPTAARRMPRPPQRSGTWRRLGELLLSTGEISQAQLAEALDRKRATGRRIGEELVAAGHLPAERLAAALKLQRRLAILAFAAALLPVHRASHATDARAHMTVSATVVDSVRVRTVRQAERFEVTPEDLKRGYVDVPAASRFDIRCGSACLFEFKPTANFIRTVRVSGLDRAAEFGRDGGTVVHTTPQSTVGGGVALDYRFMLSPDVTPGSYPWPVALTVVPM